MSETYKVDLRNIIGKFISVSDLSRGMASKIIQKVGKDKEQYIVVKNNKPEAVILSVEEYIEFIEAKENLELMKKSGDWIKNNISEVTVAQYDIVDRYRIMEEKLHKLMKSVDLE